MDIQQIAEFSGLIASQARGIIESPHRLDETQIEESWRTSRDWLIGLLHRIDHVLEAEETQPHLEHDLFREQLVTWMKQVFAAEMLLRVWGAVLTVRDQSHSEEASAELARHIMILQLKVRHRVLTLLLDEAEQSPVEMANVDRFRRKVERWTDLLLCEMVLRFDLDDFTFDARRSRELGVDYFQNQYDDVCYFTWQLLTAGLKSSFDSTEPDDYERYELPADCSRAILACLPVDAFHENGPFHTLRFARLLRDGLKPDSPPHDDLPLSFQHPLEFLEPLQPATWSLSFSKLRRKSG